MDIENVSILIVESDEIIQESIRRNLNEEGAKTKIVDSAIKAMVEIVKAEKAQEKRYDVIIAEQNNASMTGTELLDWIRINSYNIPLILTTTNPPDESIKQELKKQGAYGPLPTMPFSITDLKNMIESII